MSIRKYTVTRIDVDYYTIREEELVISIRPMLSYAPDLIVTYKDVIKWDFISSSGGQWPELDLPEQAQKRNPRIPLRKNGDSYVFYACVYYFPCPRLAGKWKDYSTAYGFE